MNFSLFIARRLYGDSSQKRPVSKLAVNLATLGVGVGLAVMIISICIVFGFKGEISRKVTGFGGYINVFNVQNNSTDTNAAVSLTEKQREQLSKVSGVTHLQRTSSKFGIFKTNENYQGIVLKGLSPEYNTDFLKANLEEGTIPTYGKEKSVNEIVISREIANALKIGVGDKVYAYFFEQTVKTRRFTVVGIFQTGMKQFDENMVLANFFSVNQLNNWQDDECSALELGVESMETLDATFDDVLHELRVLQVKEDNPVSTSYTAYTIKQLYGQLFDWLQLLNLNIWVILALMIALSCLTIISGLLILILEKTSTIGILKAFGASGSTIRKIFIYYSIFIIGRGVVLGLFLGLSLCYVQWQWHVMTLNPSQYYVSFVPISFEWIWIAALGIATLLIGTISLIGPSYMVSQIRPSKAIKFE